MAMRLRIPSWLRSGPMVKVNGKPLDATAAPGSYLTLSRTWKNGDRVEMELPMHLSVETMPDEHSTQAFLYGLLVLAGDLGGEGLTQASRGRRSRVLDQTGRGKPLAFRTSGHAKDVTLDRYVGRYEDFVLVVPWIKRRSSDQRRRGVDPGHRRPADRAGRVASVSAVVASSLPKRVGAVQR